MLTPLETLVATGTRLWLDSVDPEFIAVNRKYGATGATSNPIIIADLIKSGRFDDQLARFMDCAKAEPDRVRVAPYYLYRRGGSGRSPLLPFYCHRIREPGTRSWVKGPDDTHCHMFGFGLIYLPIALVKAFVAQMGPTSKFGDTEFSRWHMRNAKHRDVPIDWDCHAIHLHYLTPEVP